jgi:hypothetical protein
MKKLAVLLAGFAAAGVLFLGSAPAQAQATRTWVSGVGDDVNPCSRTAPCKTFAGAISKTAASGEINCIDPGGFGTVTITKSITIDCGGTFGSILNAGTNGVNVNIAGGKVTLRNISIDGAGTGVNGVNVIAAAQVLVENVQIFGQTGNGINTSSLASTANIQARNISFEFITGTGVSITTTSGFAIAQISNSSFLGMASGITAGSNSSVTVTTSVFLQNTTGAQASGSGSLNVDNSVFTNNTNAVTAGAGTNVRVSNNSLYDNNNGFTNSGTMISAGNNKVVGATATPPTTLPLK